MDKYTVSRPCARKGDMLFPLMTSGASSTCSTSVRYSSSSAAAVKFHGLFTLNELGKFIFEALADGCTAAALVDRITAEYDVDVGAAAADVEEFLGQLRGIGALVDA